MMAGLLCSVGVPVRNPGEKLLETVGSLARQTMRDFEVILSDNHSTRGLEWLEEAQKVLAGAGVQCRLVKPGRELGRVEHWNYPLSLGRGAWLKPLFVGDTLKPEFMARLREAEVGSGAWLARCDFELVQGGKVIPATRAPCQKSVLDPVDFLRWFPEYGNWLGGPINNAYAAEAWRAVGGFKPLYPSAADYHLAVSLAIRGPTLNMNETLATFHLHAERFSHGIRGRRVNGWFEVWQILGEVQTATKTLGLDFPARKLWAGVWQQGLINYYWPVRHALARMAGRG